MRGIAVVLGTKATEATKGTGREKSGQSFLELNFFSVPFVAFVLRKAM
jgi:hypothetical protein